jgi:hypothetical protein
MAHMQISDIVEGAYMTLVQWGGTIMVMSKENLS